MTASQICLHFPERLLPGKEMDGALPTSRWRLEGGGRDCFQAGRGFVRFGQPSLGFAQKTREMGAKASRGISQRPWLAFRVVPERRIGRLAHWLHEEPVAFVLSKGEVVFTCFWKLSVGSWHSEASVCPRSVPGKCFSVPQETKWPRETNPGPKRRNSEIQLQPPWCARQVSPFPLTFLLCL